LILKSKIDVSRLKIKKITVKTNIPQVMTNAAIHGGAPSHLPVLKGLQPNPFGLKPLVCARVVPLHDPKRPCYSEAAIGLAGQI